MFYFSLSILAAQAVLRSSENQTAPLLDPHSENPSPSFSPLSRVHVPVIPPLSSFTWVSEGEKRVVSRERE